MRNRWSLALAVSWFVLIAGCADGSSLPAEPTASASMSGDQHMDGHMDNMTGQEVEMYAVATDLSSTPQTWFRFRPEAFEAKVGDMLNITVKAAVGNQYPHSLVIDELQVSLGPVEAGATASTVIMLSKAGTYMFYCAEGNHQELGMQGTLTVA